MRYGLNFILFHAAIQLSHYHLPKKRKKIISPLNGLATLVENQLVMYVQVYFWVLNYISLIYMSMLMPLACFHTLSSFLQQILNLGSLSPPTLSLFRIILAIIGLFNSIWILEFNFYIRIHPFHLRYLLCGGIVVHSIPKLPLWSF